MITHDSPRLITVDEFSIGQRLDNYLIKQLKGVPKSRIYRIIRKGEVRVNKGRKKADYKLQAEDVIRIPPIRMSLLTGVSSESSEQAGVSELMQTNKYRSLAFFENSIRVFFDRINFKCCVGIMKLLRFFYINKYL